VAAPSSDEVSNERRKVYGKPSVRLSSVNSIVEGGGAGSNERVFVGVGRHYFGLSVDRGGVRIGGLEIRRRTLSRSARIAKSVRSRSGAGRPIVVKSEVYTRASWSIGRR